MNRGDIIPVFALIPDFTMETGMRMEELQAVVQALGHRIAPEHSDPERIALLGHSRGGGISLLVAATMPSIRALVTWAAVSTFDRLSEKDKRAWRSEGRLPVVNTRTGQELELGIEVFHDLRAHAVSLDLLRAARLRLAPWLILHGEDDETVPAAEAESLHRAAAGVAEIHLLAGGDHTMGIRHPFRRPSPPLTEAMNRTQAWLRRYLVGGNE